jgi:hypothetical protein
MEQYVNEVIPRIPIAPEPMRDPKQAVGKRVVLLGCRYIIPDPGKTGPRAQLRLGNVAGVVPNGSAVDRWVVRNQEDFKEDQRYYPILDRPLSRGGVPCFLSGPARGRDGARPPGGHRGGGSGTSAVILAGFSLANRLIRGLTGPGL